MPGAVPIERIFDQLASEFPGLAPAFEYHGHPAALRSQIALAVDLINQKVAQLLPEIENRENWNKLRVPLSVGRSLISKRLQEGNELLAYPGDSASDFHSRLVGWVDRTCQALQEIFVSPQHAERLGTIARPALTRTISHPAIWPSLQDHAAHGVDYARNIDEELDIAESSQGPSGSDPGGNKVFIGHGRSPVWRELKDFLADTLQLEWDEYNRVPTPGMFTPERVQEMLNEAKFAFIIMTGEDEQPDGSMRARENVVHEAGLFQGRLGFKRAILLIEQGCPPFSNILGLTVIPFPKGILGAAFEEIRRVLKREGIIEAPVGAQTGRAPEANLPSGPQDKMTVTDSVQLELQDASLSPDELALERRCMQKDEVPGLVIWLKNTGLKPLDDCSLVIHKLQAFSVRHNEFRDPEFQEQVLLAPKKLSPDGAPDGKSESDGAALARVNNTRLTELVVAVGHRFQGIRETKSRWWRAELLVKAGPRVRREIVFFRWKPGQIPEFAEDPRIHPTSDLADYL